jgi:hypothetical protein
MRAQALVRQILSFSRKTPQNCTCATLVPSCKNPSRSCALIPTTIDLRLDITATADVVLADPAQIHQS